MCNYGNDHMHSHSEYPQIVQLMPVQNNLFAVYQTEQPTEFAVQTGKSNISLVPILFMGLIRHGEKTMVEGFLHPDPSIHARMLKALKGMQPLLKMQKNYLHEKNEIDSVQVKSCRIKCAKKRG